MPKIKNTQSTWRASINFQRWIPPIIDGKIIIETIKLKIWAFELVRVKTYWRKKDGKNVEKIKKNLEKISKKLKKKFRKNLKKFKKKFKKKL